MPTAHAFEMLQVDMVCGIHMQSVANNIIVALLAITIIVSNIYILFCISVAIVYLNNF